MGDGVPRRALYFMAASCAMAVMAACSQVTGPLTGPSIGDGYTQGTRSAFQDVLFAEGIVLRSGPDCVRNPTDTGMACTGTLADGTKATATTEGGDENDMASAKLTVTVDGSTLYEGTVQDVLDQEDQGGEGG